MSQYILLIKAPLTYGLHAPGNLRLSTPHDSYALTTSNHPPTGLLILQNYNPSRLTLIHSIRAASGTDNLLRTLEIKFHSKHLHSFWYAFLPEDIEFIKSLNESNFNQMIGLIQRQLKKPDMSAPELDNFIAEQLAKADGALEEK